MSRGIHPNSRATQFKALTEPLEIRFHQSYIPEPNSGCWIWIKDADNKGYGRIRRKSKTKAFLAHRISYELHIRKTKKFVLHSCGNSYCVNPEHLYAGTQKDNMRDRTRHGRNNPPKGETHPQTHLTTKQILAIREDNRVQTIIAAEYGISQSAVSFIKSKRNWKHL